ncbi:MAG: transcriptional regulator [Xanthobacteraceae bacterium]
MAKPSNPRRPRLIRCSSEDLARQCAVSVTSIRRAELMPSATALKRVNDAVIRQGLEQAGAEFIDENDGGPGVRPRTPSPEK